MSPAPAGFIVNDVHSALNSTRVHRIIQPQGIDQIVETVRAAAANHAVISVCGGRHAMGGQQFGTDSWLIDLQHHASIRAFDETRGLITVDAGILWPEIIAACHSRHQPKLPAWSIRQKQTGADRLSIGGALSANIHGRGLRLPPFVSDI